jgi:two-component system OmpR family response regulator
VAAQRYGSNSDLRNCVTLVTRSTDAPIPRVIVKSGDTLHDEEVFDRSIDVQILRLRRKLEANPSEPTLIKTERGVGYIRDTAVEAL